MPSLEWNQANVALTDTIWPVKAAGYLAAWQADCLLASWYWRVYSTNTQQSTQQLLNNVLNNVLNNSNSVGNMI